MDIEHKRFSGMFDTGDKVVVVADDYYNAFGDKQTVLTIGSKYTITDLRRIGGYTFYAFKGVADCWFDAFGIRPVNERLN